jgi:hypothetical protein
MSGGHNGGKRKGKHNIAPAISAPFLAAAEKVEQRQGKSFPELMAEWLVKDPISILKVISKFLPRKARVRAAHDPAPTTASCSATRGCVASVVDQKSAKAASKKDPQSTCAAILLGS